MNKERELDKYKYKHADKHFGTWSFDQIGHKIKLTLSWHEQMTLYLELLLKTWRIISHCLYLFYFHVFNFEPSGMFTWLAHLYGTYFEIFDYKINKVQISHYCIWKRMRLCIHRKSTIRTAVLTQVLALNDWWTPLFFQNTSPESASGAFTAKNSHWFLFFFLPS